MKNNYYFTFGQIVGTYDTARAKAFEVFGSAWSMQYSEPDFESKWFPQGEIAVIET